MDYRQQLTLLATEYGKARNLSEASVANQARCNGNFFARLRSGGSCRVDTMTRLIQFFADNWPDDEVAWPKTISRPETQENAA